MEGLPGAALREVLSLVGGGKLEGNGSEGRVPGKGTKEEDAGVTVKDGGARNSQQKD